MAYPTIELSQESKRTVTKEAIRTETESGIGRTRAKFTKPRYQFDLKYKGISESEYETLEDYFLANQGNVFTFTYPRDNVAYNVMFNIDSMSPSYDGIDSVIDTEVSLISI